MKLRIKGDTLRLRVSRPECEALGRGERVEETTHFPGGSELRYALQPAPVTAAEASLQGALVEVRVPADGTRRWAEGLDVTLTDSIDQATAPLELLIEKDFTCVEPRAGEDQSELFPNPKTSTV